MCKTKAEILLKAQENIPIEIINSSAGWEDILISNLPFIITIVIVLSAATVTYISNRTSVASQNNIATKARQEEHENKISEFRHNWLQEVRETASELIQIIHEAQYYTKVNNQVRSDIEGLNTETNVGILEDRKKIMEESFEKIILKRSEFYKKEAKLKLLFKKDDGDVKQLFLIIDSVKSQIGKPGVISLDDNAIINMVTELQIVLKNEWEVTKNRTWQHKS